MKAYLDNGATTAVSENAVKRMTEIYTEIYGNPSSMHKMGVEAELIIKKAKKIISKNIKCNEQEIYFTSGGTEANNLAIQGFLKNKGNKKRHIITTVIEHPSVLSVYNSLEDDGYEVTYLKVDNTGRIDLEELKDSLRSDTALVSIMYVNNEIGTIQDLESISRIIKDNSAALLHVDGIQALGKIECHMKKYGIDMFTMSSHKIHGPKGVGALFIKKGITIKPLFIGGGQEKTIRPGTENVPGIAGFAVAVEEAYTNFKVVADNMNDLKNYFQIRIFEEIPNTKINGSEDNSAPHILNISFEGMRGEVLLHVLESNDIYVSTGSACASKNKSYSHVLTSLGLSNSNMEGAIRFSLSKHTTIEEIDYTMDILKKSVTDLEKIIKGR